MHGIERYGAVGKLKFAEQPLCGGDFVGLLIDLDMRQHQARLKIEGMQHLGCLAVVEVVSFASASAVERDGAA